MARVRIWDLPTRLFHAGLALCVAGLITTGLLGGDAMVWHFRLGYAVLTLLIFRLIWGFMGGYWSRWSQLPLSPTHVWAYVNGRQAVAPFAGHNPLGSWSVLAVLLVLAFQAGTGLVSDDEIANMGPLSAQVSAQWVSWATRWHKGWGKDIVILLVITHLLALAWYHGYKKQLLVPAMWHGDKVMAEPTSSSVDTVRTRWMALLALVLAALAVYALLSLGQ